MGVGRQRAAGAWTSSPQNPQPTASIDGSKHNHHLLAASLTEVTDGLGGARLEWRRGGCIAWSSTATRVSRSGSAQLCHHIPHRLLSCRRRRRRAHQSIATIDLRRGCFPRHSRSPRTVTPVCHSPVDCYLVHLEMPSACVGKAEFSAVTVQDAAPVLDAVLNQHPRLYPTGESTTCLDDPLQASLIHCCAAVGVAGCPM
ncbi:hypothetical protein QBC39DRAFT_83531 [Podospora conica]|nr:hypothetical protein QBC39DRAFT_83531 [Schizothecium conicum]